MKRMVETHLNEEALDDVLIGMGSAESQAHLARCLECRARVEEFEQNIDLFNETTMAWTEARPSCSVRQPYSSPRFQVPLGLIGSFAAAILGIAIAVPLWQHEHSSPRATQAIQVSEHQDSEMQIAQDNELMQAVNEAISAPERSPFDEYGLVERPRRHAKARPR